MSTFKNQFQYLFAAFLLVHASVEVWASHFSFMRFRKGSSHAICSECVKHKMIIQGLGHHLVARKMQMSLLYSHLSAQFQDRCTYWKKRRLSRAHGIDVVIISDGMDQAKYALARHPFHEGEAIPFCGTVHGCTWPRPLCMVGAWVFLSAREIFAKTPIHRLKFLQAA